MNHPKKEINETIKRTKRYWYVDGFAEISTGMLFILIILYNYAAGRVQQPVWQIILFVLGLPALVILGSRGVSRIVSRLKEKYTYPRTGYVAYQRKSGSRRWKRVLLAGILGAVVGMVTSLLSGNLPVIYQQLFVAVAIALVSIYIGYSMGLRRFYLIAGASLALSAVLILSGITEAEYFLSFFLGQGLIWIVSGLLTLNQYLRHTQPPLEDEA